MAASRSVTAVTAATANQDAEYQTSNHATKTKTKTEATEEAKERVSEITSHGLPKPLIEEQTALPKITVEAQRYFEIPLAIFIATLVI
ncbi:hypothetical protein N7467_007123 [Penicillium canescens]|nr:hypothetical protein N7467_007123 [Penicillium canescens]